MGSGIAICAACAGFDVTVVDSTRAAVAAATDRVHGHFEQAVAKGRLSPDASAAARQRIVANTALEALASADLVIEAVFENLATKQSVFAQLGVICRPGAVLATNTSTLDVDAIAAASRRPSDVVGMHFFSPAHVMRLLEIVRGRESGPAALATAREVGQRLGKVNVVVGNCFGFVGNRMLYAYGREKEQMMLEGTSPETIDGALEEFGMAMGPNAVGDLAGLDIGYQVRRAWAGRPADPLYFRVADLLVENGRLGQKSGRGFYRYESGIRMRLPDAEVVALIRAEAARLGVTPREISAPEIVERCILSLVNEGARVLEDGIAESAADIDVIWCNGYGFPRDRGGPMRYADTLGLTAVLERLRAYEARYGCGHWTPSVRIDRLACAQVGFHGSNVKP